MGQPQRKSYEFNFRTQICGKFFQGPPYEGQNFYKAPSLHQAPRQVFVNGPLATTNIGNEQWIFSKMLANCMHQIARNGFRKCNFFSF